VAFEPETLGSLSKTQILA